MKSRAIKIIKRLKYNGFEASFVGGSVRNEQWNKIHGTRIPVKDYDIVTNATYDDLAKLFDNVTQRGAGFLVSIVNYGGYEFEVAQYRTETYADDSTTRPDEVQAAKTLEEDLKRRDFTINTLTEDENGNIVDLMGGLDDLKNKLIKCVGNPAVRFNEDKLRMLRAFRFVAQLDGDLDDETSVAISECVSLFRDIPNERVKVEMDKILLSPHAPRTLMIMKRLGFGKAEFYNSIDKKYVPFFESLFSLNDIAFIKNVSILLNKRGLDITEVYALLYQDFKYNYVVKELEEMGLLSASQVERVKILVKNVEINMNQSRSRLLLLINDIGEQKGRKYLNDILNSYVKMYGTNFNKIRGFMGNRPIFKSELPFNGKDVIEKGKEYGFNDPGPWVSTVLNHCLIDSVMFNKIDLDESVKYIGGMMKVNG